MEINFFRAPSVYDIHSIRVNRGGGRVDLLRTNLFNKSKEIITEVISFYGSVSTDTFLSRIKKLHRAAGLEQRTITFYGINNVSNGACCLCDSIVHIFTSVVPFTISS